jgi:hypothetical protein
VGLSPQQAVGQGWPVTGDDGKVKYQNLFEFDNAAVRAAFSDAVVRAVRAFAPEALENTGTAA